MAKTRPYPWPAASRRDGPVKVDTPLYRLLEWAARRVVEELARQATARRQDGRRT